MIHKLHIKDIKEIRELVEELLHDKTDVEKGFLNYNWDKKRYEEHIKNSTYSYKYNFFRRLKGFLITHTKKEVHKLKDNILRDDKEIINEIEKDAEKNNITNYVYGLKIGIDNEFNRSGIGKKMMKQLFKDCKCTVYVAIAQKPIKNNASIHFTQGLGGKLITKVNKKGWTWGLYKINV